MSASALRLLTAPLAAAALHCSLTDYRCASPDCGQLFGWLLYSEPCVAGPLFAAYAGSAAADAATFIRQDRAGGCLAGGAAAAGFGSPLEAHLGQDDGSLVALDGAGQRQFNTFVGAAAGNERATGAVRLADGGLVLATETGNAFARFPDEVFEGSPGIVSIGLLRMDAAGRIERVRYLSSPGAPCYDARLYREGDGFLVFANCEGPLQSSAGAPLISHQSPGQADLLLARLNSDLSVRWHVFFGGAGYDSVGALSQIPGGGYYLTAKVGTPGLTPAIFAAGRNAFGGADDGALIRVAADGAYLWHRYFGGAGVDDARGGATSPDGRTVYVAGNAASDFLSNSLQAYIADDIYVMALDSDGAVLWNTYVGGAGVDRAAAIAPHSAGGVWLAGGAGASFGQPLRPFSFGTDALIAHVTAQGALRWHLFAGVSGTDEANDLIAECSGSALAHLTVQGDVGFGAVRSAPSGGADALALRIGPDGQTP